MWTLMQGLAKRDKVRVSLLTAADVPEKTVVQNVEVRGVVPPKLTAQVWRPMRALALMHYAFSIGRAIRQSHADVIFLKLPSFELFAIAATGWFLRKPIVFRVVSNWEMNEQTLASQIFEGSRLKARLFRICLRHFRFVICQTHHQKSELNRNYEVYAERISNVHELPEISAPYLNRVGVLWVGRAHPAKHPHAFLELADANHDVSHTMIMAPAQEYFELTNEVVNAASKRTNVHFKPGVPSGEVNKFYRQTRVFVLTSEAEGFSNVVIEALKYGVPVVSLWWNPDGLFQPIGESSDLDCPAMPGFVTNGSLASAAAMVKRLHDNADFWRACSHKATEYVRNTHALDVVLPQYEALFASATT